MQILFATASINLSMLDKNFISLYEESFKKHWDYPAFTNYEKATYYYRDVATEIEKLHIKFQQLGLERGDKVALMGKDSAEWCITFLATITYGAVIVPILQDFTAEDAMTIIEHSDSKILFINSTIWDHMSIEKLSMVHYVEDLQSRKTLLDLKNQYDEEACKHIFDEKYPYGFTIGDIKYYQTPNNKLILLNYTSGTTGFSKGVMVTGNNLAGNIMFCRDHQIVKEHERLLCFLPLAHTYSCTVNLLLASSLGVHVTILGRMPTPRILGKAFKDVSPHVVISVPLILEKIYQGTIYPIIQKPKFKFLLKIPFVKESIHKKIRNKLMAGMGGIAREVIVGGAALNPEVGAFLKKIGFPLTVGYGMTECAPLICFTPSKDWRLDSCGAVLKGYMEARISTKEVEQTNFEHASDHGRPIGEIQVRGENTCLGYYKNEEQTKALFTEDGWLRTGDVGSMDEDNFIYIKGRSKTMLLGSSGQNIYPEEIEAKISLIPHVLENLILMRKGKLEALIVLNPVSIADQGLTEEEVWQSVQEKRREINAQLALYEQITQFELHKEPFEKTPKQSIKRFLYK